jgi:hypothetical protein
MLALYRAVWRATGREQVFLIVLSWSSPRWRRRR